MQRTETVSYTLSRSIIRSLGPSSMLDKQAKEKLLTILWCDFWRDGDEPFAKKVYFRFNPFHARDLLMRSWQAIGLVSVSALDKSIVLGDLGQEFLFNARGEMNTSERLEKLEQHVERSREDESKYASVILAIQDMKRDISFLNGAYADTSDELRKLRLSLVRGL